MKPRPAVTRLLTAKSAAGKRPWPGPKPASQRLQGGLRAEEGGTGLLEPLQGAAQVTGHLGYCAS